MTNKEYQLVERCFICGSRIGRGNHPHLPVHERMNKLVSVSQTVEHSSTIISDILSRILNETVMHEETICRICFNLLNDIDYHLKEAQEKTDEITNKFLDKGKDPLSYNPQPIVVTTATSEATASDDSDDNEGETLRRGRASAGRRRKGQSPAPGAALASTVVVKESPSVRDGRLTDPETEAQLTEDEMSVNTINRNKAKLLSQVLNPRKAAATVLASQSQGKEPPKLQDSKRVASDEASEKSIPVILSKKRRHVSAGGKKRKRRRRDQEEESDGGEALTPSKRIQEQLTSREDEVVTVRRVDHVRGNKAEEQLVTVNMDDLGDLLSKAPKDAYFAKKSEPATARRAQTTRGEEEGGQLEKPRCPFCGKTFKRTANLQLHIDRSHQEASTAQQEHPIPETHRCHLCPREFTNSRSLSTHLQDHDQERLKAEKDERQRRVDEAAGKTPWSSSPAKSQARKKKRPENNKPPVGADEAKATCPQCGKTFRRHFNMRIHVDRVHNKVKPFPCKFCDKAFATNSDLRQHIGVHGEGQRFECEECGRTFNNRDSIILHRKQHSNARTHFCVVCKKGFFKASCLNRHMRSHTGERPFKCNSCGKGFSQSTTLKAHVAKCGKDADAAKDERQQSDSYEFVST